MADVSGVVSFATMIELEEREKKKKGKTDIKLSHEYCEFCTFLNPGDPDFHLTLLRSCRQIYLEGITLLWTTNTFSFIDATTFQTFMMRRIDHQKEMITSLRLDMDWSNGGSEEWNKVLDMPLIGSLTGLRHLRLHIDCCMESGLYQTTKKKIFHGSHCEGMRKLTTLPLTSVEVGVKDPAQAGLHYGWIWSKDERLEFGNGLRSLLLDPQGTEP